MLIGTWLLLTFGLLSSWFVASLLVAPRHQQVGPPPVELNASAFETDSRSGARIHGWYTEPRDPRGVVVLLHGIRGTRASMLARAKMLHHARYATVMIDLQAHGESLGENITLGHLEKYDVQAAVQFAKAMIPDEPVAVIGVSLGGAAALLATPLDVDAMVLESVFPNIEAAVHNRVDAILGPLSWLPAKILLVQLKPRLGIPAEDLQPIQHIADVGCPVFLISGSNDKHTTERETRSMHQAASQPKKLWIVEGAAHEDLAKHSPDEYEKKILGFLNQQLAIDSAE
ncbi:MAG: alpha/beta hydrolase [Planctomycetota bacterium]